MEALVKVTFDALIGKIVVSMARNFLNLVTMATK